MKIHLWSREGIKSNPVVEIGILLVLWGLLGIAMIAITLLSGALLSRDLYLWGTLIGGIVLALMFILRLDELAAASVIAVHLYVDWYLGIYFVGLVITLALLAAFFLARSPRYPWAEPGALWLWGLFLALTIFPAIRGATNIFDETMYYPNDIFGAFIIYWLGTVIARDSASVRRLLMALAAVGTLIAIHTVIQQITGKFLLESSRASSALAAVSNYQLYQSGVHRVGSFFVDPNWDGTFLAMSLTITCGLFADSTSWQGKVFYLVEMALIVPALLFTFSIGSVIGAVAGIMTFIVFAGHAHSRIVLPVFILLGIAVMAVSFPTQIHLFLQHSSDPEELLLRNGAWETALRMIQAFPLTGIGLGLQAYAQASEPYRVYAQFIPLAHPHDSYLELAVMAGIPVIVVFLALISFALWLAFRNWMLADVRTRCLLGSGIAAVVTLSVNSVSINGWTLPPLAAFGWLILGVISSSLLMKSLNAGRQK